MNSDSWRIDIDQVQENGVEVLELLKRVADPSIAYSERRYFISDMKERLELMDTAVKRLQEIIERELPRG